ncbi:MAG: ATP synthase F1 subunit gamma [Planctomycetes bacterium]|nr:ATP synthase F1 subunit gamma [Planctomycetota bacterium]
MAKSSKTIRKRIKSVVSTKKITRTMEMVATSKLQKSQSKVIGSRPYTTTLASLLEVISAAVGSLGNFPLFAKRNPTKKVLVFVITSNRGLCGGYNANLVRKAREHIASLRADGLEVAVHVAGKKGIAALKFAGDQVDQTRTDLTDRPTYAEAENVGRPLLDAFLKYEADRVDVVYADFRSIGQQPPTALTVLPLGAASVGAPAKSDAHAKATPDFLFEPGPAEILEELAAVYVKNVLYRMLLSAVASEQLARRVAMKNATDNANDMQKSLTREYNKARQAMITQEIAEIVGGAAALE